MNFRILVWFLMIFGGGTISVFLDRIFFKQIWESALWHYVSFILGVIILAAVIIVSKNTGRTLAKYGRKGNIKRLETNVLVKEGIYKYMRHPMHLGLMFFPLAFGLLIGSPVFLSVFSPLEIMFIFMMIKYYEEPEAVRKFDGDYLEYMKETPGFCISAECIKALFKKVEKNYYERENGD